MPARKGPNGKDFNSKEATCSYGDNIGYPLFGRGLLGDLRVSELPDVVQCEVSSFDGRVINVVSSAGLAPGDLCLLYRSGEYERIQIQSVRGSAIVCTSPPTINGTILVKIIQVHVLNVDQPFKEAVLTAITARYVQFESEFVTLTPVMLWAGQLDEHETHELVQVIGT